MNPVSVSEGDGPVILGQPHGSVALPDGVAERFNERGRAVADTDWHIHRLYDGLLPGATVVQAAFSRYVIDANRDPSGSSLYPGQTATELCPTVDFDGEPIYRRGEEPTSEEAEARRRDFHAVYHAALAQQIVRVKAKHGVVLLFDCHSIRSRCPFLFEGELPDFSLGTNDSTTCDARIERTAGAVCAEATGYSSALNGRFKGGWTTRHYGEPANGTHSIQLELAQRTYMEEHAPWRYCEKRATEVRVHLKELLGRLEQLVQNLA